jgi:hypothetical protein
VCKSCARRFYYSFASFSRNCSRRSPMRSILRSAYDEALSLAIPRSASSRADALRKVLRWARRKRPGGRPDPGPFGSRPKDDALARVRECRNGRHQATRGAVCSHTQKRLSLLTPRHSRSQVLRRSTKRAVIRRGVCSVFKHRLSTWLTMAWKDDL